MSFDKTVRRHLSSCYGLEAEDVEQVFSTYTEVIGRATARLDAALGEGHADEASAQAHALKGALLNLGQDGLARTASDLEKELKRVINHETMLRARQFMEDLAPITWNLSGIEEEI